MAVRRAPFLRLLFWLKWKLLWRTYARSRAAAFGVILAVLVFLPISLGIAVACGAGFLNFPGELKEHLLRGVLLGIYLFWVLSPLLGYALSESYDITKLLIYPLSARQIFTGAILGSLLDFPVVLLFPTLGAALFAFGRGLFAFPITLAALALLLFHTLSLSQALVLASAGVLRSRRFRDLAIVLIPVFWMGYYVLTQSLSRHLIRIDWKAFLQSSTWATLGWLPPGLAARAAAAAHAGALPVALGLLLALLAWTMVTVHLAGWMIERIYAGDVSNPQPAPRPVAGRTATTAGRGRRVATRSLRLGLPPVVEAMVEKELKYMLRDPFFKIALMNMVYMLFVAVFAFFGGQRGQRFGASGPAMLWSMTGFMLLSQMSLPFNMFGTEGGAAPLLFLTPAPRRQLLLGKNLALFGALSGANFVFLVIVATVAKAPGMFAPVFCWMELALLVFVAIGNLVSIWLPHRAVARGWRTRQQSASQGCAYGFFYMLVSLVAFALLAPVAAGLVLPTFIVDRGWYALGVPLSAAYAVGLYLLSLRIAEPLLCQRELALLERVSAPAE